MQVYKNDVFENFVPKGIDKSEYMCYNIRAVSVMAFSVGGKTRLQGRMDGMRGVSFCDGAGQGGRLHRRNV